VVLVGDNALFGHLQDRYGVILWVGTSNGLNRFAKAVILLPI
jgi:hypothetical protein